MIMTNTGMAYIVDDSLVIVPENKKVKVFYDNSGMYFPGSGSLRHVAILLVRIELAWRVYEGYVPQHVSAKDALDWIKAYGDDVGEQRALVFIQDHPIEQRIRALPYVKS